MLDFSKGPVFKVFVNSSGNKKIISSLGLPSPDISVHGKTTVVSYPGEINIRITYKRMAKEIIAVLNLENNSDAMIEKLEFPVMQYRKVNEFDQLLVGTDWGDNIQRPTRFIKEINWEGNFSCAYIPHPPKEIIYTYPSIMAMQYLCLYNSARSLYLASYSKGVSTMTFHVRVLDYSGLEFAICHYPYLSKCKWNSPECSFAIIQGDWHSAADIYKSHAEKMFRNPDVPGHLRDDFHGFIQLPMKFAGKEPNCDYRDIPDYFRKVKETGMNCIRVYAWCNRGHDTGDPDSKIIPELGTADDLKNAMNKIMGLYG